MKANTLSSTYVEILSKYFQFNWSNILLYFKVSLLLLKYTISVLCPLLGPPLKWPLWPLKGMGKDFSLSLFFLVKLGSKRAQSQWEAIYRLHSGCMRSREPWRLHCEPWSCCTKVEIFVLQQSVDKYCTIHKKKVQV